MTDPVLVEPQIGHLHTYFVFPFSIDRELVLARHSHIWKNRLWIEGLDDWIQAHHGLNEISRRLGPWKRASHISFDADSRAYQNMVFFHPIVRRIYFDYGSSGDRMSLLRRYEIEGPPDFRLQLYAADVRGRDAAVDVSKLRLYLFANGIGLLAIGVEAFHRPASQALWINEMMRKIYPSSGRQRREGRIPSLMRLTLQHEGETHLLVEETFQTCHLRAFQPPLSALITSLLYFLDYGMQEYEPVLDERMIVYTYLAIDPQGLPRGWCGSPAHEQLVSRVLYVDRWGSGYRYDPDFIRKQLDRHLYRRWAHQGTYYGFTSYSNITVTFGEFDCGDHELREGFLVHRMFDSRHYVMLLIALFYRATLLEFAERVALVSRRLYLDLEDNRLSPESVEFANRLRSDFLTFYNYWHFDEVANKDEESEHFMKQCEGFNVFPMLEHTDHEVVRMSSTLSEYYQARSGEAVNRLAMISMILGAGAVFTGYFGMNFAEDFARTFFEPAGSRTAHWLAIAAVSVFSLAAIGFGVFVVFANWSDYKDVLLPRRARTPRLQSLRKVDDEFPLD